MNKIENKKIKENAYIEKLESGLTVVIIPKKNTNKKYVIWGTNFGSIDNRFIMPGTGEEVFIPDGVAHFLEHKMFEQENGSNSLDTLMALGMDANAYTTNDHTSYLFECTEDFYKGLDELMDYVQNPYFTDENVEKEKGIIGQEIKMYDDDPGFQLYINTMECLYKNNPVRLDIAGTVESIGEITPDVLYKCYNTFYNPGNMVMVVSGDFKPDELLGQIKSRLKPQKDIGEIKRIYPEEPEEINENYKEVKMEVSTPLWMIGFKDKTSSKEELVKRHVAIEILLSMIVGKSSKLYKELYDEGLLLSEPDLYYEFSKQYAHVLISNQSKDPEKVKEKILNQISDISSKPLDKEHFERIKKKIYGEYITEFNNVANISKMFLADGFKGVNSFDYIDHYNDVTMEYAMSVLKEVFAPEKQVMSVVK